MSRLPFPASLLPHAGAFSESLPVCDSPFLVNGDGGGPPLKGDCGCSEGNIYGVLQEGIEMDKGLTPL